MMSTTHSLAGVAVADVTLAVAPEFAPVAVAGAAIGGVFPDLDLYADHRKTLHFPVYYSAATVGSLAVTVLIPNAVTVGVSFFLLAAALHSVMDIFGAGRESKPWLRRSNRAVYDHYRGRWIRPRHWIRYDGAPEDLLLAIVLAIPSLLVHSGLTHDLIIGALCLSAVYTLIRRPLVERAEQVVEHLPRKYRHLLRRHLL